MYHSVFSLSVYLSLCDVIFLSEHIFSLPEEGLRWSVDLFCYHHVNVSNYILREINKCLVYTNFSSSLN